MSYVLYTDRKFWNTDWKFTRFQLAGKESDMYEWQQTPTELNMHPKVWLGSKNIKQFYYSEFADISCQVPEFRKKQVLSTYCLTYKKCMISACSLRFSDCDSCSTISCTFMFSYPVSVANACLSANGHILWPSFGEPVGLPTGVRWGVPWGVPCGVWQGEWVPFRCGCEATSVKWDSQFQNHILTVLYRSINPSIFHINIPQTEFYHQFSFYRYHFPHCRQ